MKINVCIKTLFRAIHCWPECPFEEVFYLRQPHRHRFFVRLKFAVNHSDREVEFIVALNKLNSFLQANYEGQDIGGLSCEVIALDILNQFTADGAFYCSVYEDDENGAEVYYETGGEVRHED